jgi:cell wall-associated NlpC family hydrolase
VSTIAWLLILAGVLIMRSAIKGRAAYLPTDISDAFLALIQGDSEELSSVLARSGDGLDSEQTDTTAYESGMGDAANPPRGIGSGGGGTDIGAAAVKRGAAAKGYRWTATGPDYYDCSGLMWRACQDAGVYKGARFTTFNVGSLKAFTRVTDPANDDLVVWPTHHMGVVTGPDTYYSARSVKSGIGYSKISAFSKGKPIYLRARGDG